MSTPMEDLAAFFLDREQKREGAIARFREEHVTNPQLVHEVMAEAFDKCWICEKPLIGQQQKGETG